jgi:hypothetical protein
LLVYRRERKDGDLEGLQAAGGYSRNADCSCEYYAAYTVRQYVTGEVVSVSW